MLLELTLCTTTIVGSRRQGGRQQLPPDFLDDLSNLVAQRLCKRHVDPSSWPTIPDMAIWYLDLKHLFEAQRLSAELEIGCGAMPDARLVFDRPDCTRFDLYRIGCGFR